MKNNQKITQGMSISAAALISIFIVKVIQMVFTVQDVSLLQVLLAFLAATIGYELRGKVSKGGSD